MSNPLVIINGFGAPRAASQLISIFFKRRGFQVTVAPQYPLAMADVRKSSQLVGGHIDRVLAETGAERVDLVGISLGGVIGYHYVKLGAGAQTVATLVSVGGPLQGTPAAKVSALPPLRFIPAMRQMRPCDPLVKALREASAPAGVRLIAIGTKGDTLAPTPTWRAADTENVFSPYGIFPVGHWCLYSDPRNLGLIADLLQPS